MTTITAYDALTRGLKMSESKIDTLVKKQGTLLNTSYSSPFIFYTYSVPNRLDSDEYVIKVYDSYLPPAYWLRYFNDDSKVITIDFENLIPAATENFYINVQPTTILNDSDTIYGNKYNDTILGFGGNDYIYGNGGNDVLNGGSGNDFIDGGKGSDTVDYSEKTTSIRLSLDKSGSAAVYIDGIGEDSIANIENIIGGSGNDEINGNTFSNKLSGAIGNDKIQGDAGNDILNGGVGNDTLLGGYNSDQLYGGDGDDWLSGFEEYNDSQLTDAEFSNKLTTEKNNSIDKLYGGKGNDFYTLDLYLNTPEIIENANEGDDTILGDLASYTLGSNVENYVNDRSFFSSTVVITGNNLNNFIKTSPSGWDSTYEIFATVSNHTKQEAFYGLAGDDIMMGGAGNDMLDGGAGNDTLDGGADSDVMWGGAGDDVYYVDNTNDKTNEGLSTTNTADATGVDLVYSSITRTLSKYIENLTLTGTEDVNGTGNALANILTGNSAANTLNGGAGNDTLNGGKGNDVLTGGKGRDFFDFASVLNGTTNVDTITDFNRADDLIRLNSAVIPGLGAKTGALSSAAFVSGAGRKTAEGASDRVIYNTSTGELYYDADGTGSSPAIKIALIGTSSSRPILDHTDFLII